MSQLLLDIHARQQAKHAVTVEALRGYLKSLARVRADGVVNSDDAARWLTDNGFSGDLRVIGCVLKAPHFRQVGFAKSERRRGHHALWSVA